MTCYFITSDTHIRLDNTNKANKIYFLIKKISFIYHRMVVNQIQLDQILVDYPI